MTVIFRSLSSQAIGYHLFQSAARDPVPVDGHDDTTTVLREIMDLPPESTSALDYLRGHQGGVGDGRLIGILGDS